MGQHPMDPHWPKEMYAITQFETLGPDRTRVTITWRPYEASVESEEAFDKARDSMTGGFTGTFEKLTAYLAELQSA